MSVPHGIAICMMAAASIAAGLAGQDTPGQSAPKTPITLAAPADAADTSNVADIVIPTLMQRITVTATRGPEELKDVPEAVTVLPTDAIERRAAETPNEMLAEEPAIFSPRVAVQGSPIVRGQIGNRVLYLWDGIRVNNGALFSGPNGFFNQMPLNAIDHMEVVRGPGAVQYGSDAIGGVINIIPIKAGTVTPTPHFGGELMFRYGTVDTEKTPDANFWFSGPKVSFTAGAFGQLVGDYNAPSLSRISSTGFDNAGGSVSMGYRISPRQNFGVTWLEDRRFDVETYSQSKLNASGIPRIFGPFEQRGLLKFYYQRDHLGKWSNGLNAYGYYEYYDSLRNTLVETSSLFNLTKTSTGQKVAGGGVENTNLIRRHRVVYGADYRREELGTDKNLFTTTKSTGAVSATIPNGNVPNGDYDVADAFALTELRPVQRLTVTLGTRLESAVLQSYPRPQDAVAPFTVDMLRLHKRWNSLTWNSGAVYNLKGGLGFAANIAAGFRAPTFSDALSTGVPVFASGVATVPSPGVKPEHSVTYEAGPRYVSRRLQFSLTAYTNQLTDLLGSAPAGTINIPGVGVVTALANQNIASAYVRGVEAALNWQLHTSWLLFGNFTDTRGQDTHANVPLRFIPPAFGTMGIRWARPGSRWWAEPSVVIVDRLRRHAPQDELDAGFSRDPGYGSPSATNPPLRPNFQIPGYAIANLRVGVSLWKEGNREFELFCSVNNLLNLRYREAYSQQELLAPGTGGVMGGRLRF